MGRCVRMVVGLHLHDKGRRSHPTLHDKGFRSHPILHDKGFLSHPTLHDKRLRYHPTMQISPVAVVVVIVW